jgi:hypothetical protein
MEPHIASFVPALSVVVQSKGKWNFFDLPPLGIWRRRSPFVLPATEALRLSDFVGLVSLRVHEVTAKHPVANEPRKSKIATGEQINDADST